MKTNDVVVTGLGAVSPVGVGIESTFAAAMAGSCGIQVISEEEAGGVPVRLRGKVDEAALKDVTDQEKITYDRSVVFALQAMREAWAHAGQPEVDPTRLAVSVSAGIAGVGSLVETHERLRDHGATGVRATTIPRSMPNAVAAVLAIELKARAGTYCPISACSSGSDALAYAYRLLALGEADIVVAGGTEAILRPAAVMGFAALRALSRNHDAPHLAARPFDRSRDGFVLGEGAGVLVLETAEHARRRGAEVLGVLRGVGVTSDGFHLVAPEPSGAGAANAMRRALATSELEASDVAAVSAHATGTRLGDAVEAKALRAVFGEALPQVGVTGLKSMVGHLVGASGAVAAAVAVRGLRDEVVTPTPNFAEPDTNVSLNISADGPTALPDNGARAMLVNSFGFGGQNVSLCFTGS